MNDQSRRWQNGEELPEEMDPHGVEGAHQDPVFNEPKEFASDGVITPAALTKYVNNGVIKMAHKIYMQSMEKRLDIFTNSYDKNWAKDVWNETAPTGMLNKLDLTKFALQYLNEAGQRLLRWVDLNEEESALHGLGKYNGLGDTMLVRKTNGEETSSAVINDVITTTFEDNFAELNKLFSVDGKDQLTRDNFIYQGPDNKDLLPFYLDTNPEDGTLKWALTIPRKDDDAAFNPAMIKVTNDGQNVETKRSQRKDFKSDRAEHSSPRNDFDFIADRDSAQRALGRETAH